MAEGLEPGGVLCSLHEEPGPLYALVGQGLCEPLEEVGAVPPVLRPGAEAADVGVPVPDVDYAGGVLGGDV